MTILSDRDIVTRCTADRPMIDPFIPTLITQEGGRNVISYGLSSSGYDIRLDTHFRVFQPYRGQEPVDPKHPNTTMWDRVEGDYVDIPARGCVLANSMERFTMPDDVMGECLGKSTYARNFLVVNVTPLEPGWCGFLTVELCNLLEVPLRVYAREGIAQVVFHTLSSIPLVTYAARAGKYQNQAATPTFGKV